LSQQRVERANLENEIDTENTGELTKLRSEIAIQTEGELRGVAENLKTRINQDGEKTLKYFKIVLIFIKKICVGREFFNYVIQTVIVKR
jgi:hypothetical protein